MALDENRFIDPASPVMEGELVCGFIDHEGTLHKSFSLHEMSGDEEDILVGEGPVVQRLNRVIFNCLDRIGDITDKTALKFAVKSLAMPDRLLLLIRLRQLSVGKDFKMEIVCPDCKKTNRVKVDLSTLDTTEMDDPHARNRSDNIGDEDRPFMVKWHIMTMADEEWLQSQKKASSEKLTLAMMARVESVDGVALDRSTPKGLKAAKKLLKRLPLRKRIRIRNLFKKHEGEIDTDLQYNCPACQFEIKGELDVGQRDFFFPSEA